MGEMGYGYGSECHLLRWMGRHRKEFDIRVLQRINQEKSSIQWLDFNFNPQAIWPDEEWLGLDFLKGTEFESKLKDWEQYWPTKVKKGVPNWDSVGWVVSPSGHHFLLLVEAKAEAKEISSRCNAGPESKVRIENTFMIVKEALGVDPAKDWTKPYYQYANRIATLYFLHKQKIPACLLFIYFVGDLKGLCRNSPQTEEEWREVLQNQKNCIGLPDRHLLFDQIRELFLPVSL